jgi:hypothetical protein
MVKISDFNFEIFTKKYEKNIRVNLTALMRSSNAGWLHLFF